MEYEKLLKQREAVEVSIHVLTSWLWEEFCHCYLPSLQFTLLHYPIDILVQLAVLTSDYHLSV